MPTYITGDLGSNVKKIDTSLRAPEDPPYGGGGVLAAPGLIVTPR